MARYGVSKNHRYFIGLTKEIQGIGLLVSIGANKNFKTTITVDFRLLWFSVWIIIMYEKRKKTMAM